MLLTDKLMIGAMFKTTFKILIFNYLLANFATNVTATDNHADILRGIHLKAYAYEVFVFFFSNASNILF